MKTARPDSLCSVHNPTRHIILEEKIPTCRTTHFLMEDATQKVVNFGSTQLFKEETTADMCMGSYMTAPSSI